VKAIVFVGGGRITAAMVAGLRLAKYERPIIVHDRHPHKLRRLKKQFGVSVEPRLRNALKRRGLLILAVRPDSVGIALEEIRKINHPLDGVSLAAGIPLSRLRALSGSAIRWARAMPSPACRTGRGLTALAFERTFSRRVRSDVRRLFERVGTVLDIPESQFDAFTVTYSSSHGYHALSALAAAGQKLGLSRDIALTAAAHALADGIVSWRDSNLSLEILLQEAATPGGIASAVMGAMDSSGYKLVIQRGLRAGITRAHKNAR
jgi:pyrroline-5-carboxylate reductase